MAEHTGAMGAVDIEGATTTSLSNCAVMQVLNTYELVEDILVRLPLEDLILAMNASQFIRQVVASSKAIRSRFISLTRGFCFGRLESPYAYGSRVRSTLGGECLDNIEFAFWTSLRNSPHACDRTNIDIFVSRKGRHEAVGILERLPHSQGSLKISDGINTKVIIKPYDFQVWSVRIYGRDWEHPLALYCHLAERRQTAEIEHMITFHGGWANYWEHWEC